MRLFQTLYDALHGGPDGPPPLHPHEAKEPLPVPLRTRMGTPADVAYILDAKAKRRGRGGGWRESLAELLTLLDHADTPTHRAALADDLNVDISDLAAADAGAALHAALIQRLANNDAIAPQDFFK
ncbi:MAG: DUF3597 family protein [Phenylobacterium sp.]|uniref:DUF3597 family protein n=1 Tax=Phenylobacterium sp. TaxID=1871053 RepID=UPI001A4607C7|nr:DUF3597 family protein [Phenylobacterium sp.]MBL8553467.1 DUF3597 family protein [Phenylobacterium sp.]